MRHPGLALFLVGCLLTRPAFTQSSFKFAHISDTHIGGAVTAAEDLRNTVKDINADSSL